MKIKVYYSNKTNIILKLINKLKNSKVWIIKIKFDSYFKLLYKFNIM